MRKCFFLFLLALSALGAFAQKPDALKMFREKRYDEGIEIGLEEIKANPRNVEAYVVLCWNLNAAHQYARAESYAKTAYQYDKSNTRIIESLAESYYFQGKNASALEFFQLYISLVKPDAKDYGWAYYYMGEIYVRLEKYEHADIAFTNAVSVDSKRDVWWCRCGYAREMAASYRLALAAYEKAVALSPKYADALRGLERVRPKIR